LLLSNQYSKMLAYWQCRVAALTTDAAVKCDCEKQVTDNTANKDRSGSETSVARQRPDEPFSTGAELAMACLIPDPALARAPAPGAAVLCGFTIPVFQPPRC
jgi:hypothetical protein